MRTRSILGTLLALLVVTGLVVIGIVVFVRDAGPSDLEKSAVLREEQGKPGTTTLATDQATEARRADETTEETTASTTGVVEAAVTLDEARWPAGEAVRFRVLDADTLEPLPKFRMRIAQYIGEQPHCVSTTDIEGRVTTPAIFQRGTIDIQHDYRPKDADYPEPWEFIEETFLLETGTTDIVEFEAHARDPSLALFVRVLHADGTPVFGRSVELVEGRRNEDGELRYTYWRFDDTDADGIARFLLYGRDSLDSPFAVGMHEADGDEVWDTLYLEPPIHEGPWDLQLYFGGSASVRVIDEEARPVEGAQVWPAIMNQGIRGAYTEIAVTDAQGLAHFASLPTGDYTVRVADTKKDRRSTDVQFELDRGGHAEVEVRLSAAEAKELAVAGKMFDVDGTPLDEGWVTYSIDRGEPHRALCDERGHFEVWSVRGESVTVDSRTSVFSDPFEPVKTTVPFGTTDLEFKKTKAMEIAYVVFRVIDAATKEAIAHEADTAIALYRAPADGERVTASALFGPDEGVTEVEFMPHTDLRWVVTALGYREQRGALPIPDRSAEIPIYTIELTRGFERELVVRDSATGARIAGATVKSNTGVPLATTDAGGHARIELEEWPEYVTIEHEGHETLRWEAALHWFQFSDQAWMTRM